MLVAVAVAVVVAGACSSGSGSAPQVSVPADHPVALLAEADGTLLYAERLTGAVRRVGTDDVLDPEPVATVATSGSVSDQRGLLGLARRDDGSLYAAWTRAADGRLVVGRLGGPEPTIVWEGPPSADLANGGHLAFGPDGRLVIGIGDLLEDRALADDPTVPNRKMLSLDPDGPPAQVPVVLSTGWNNPFAFAFTDDGVLWVADNSPGDQPERIGRGDRPASEASALPTAEQGEAAPSALVALGADRLGRCGFLTGRVDEVVIEGDRASLSGREVAAPCATGAALLVDGRLALALDDAIALTPTPLRSG